MESHPDAKPTVPRVSPLRGLILLHGIDATKLLCPYSPDCPFVACNVSAEKRSRHLCDHVRHRHLRDDQDQRVSLRLTMSLPIEITSDPISRDFLPPSKVKGRSFRVSSVHLRGKYVERVKQFKYLGTILSDDCTLRAEILHRCDKARKAFHMIPFKLWACMHINLYVRWELLKHVVLPCLFYSSEAWAPNCKDMSMLESTYYEFLRVISGQLTHWTRFPSGLQGWDRPSREEVEITLNNPNVEDWLRTARLRLYGVVTRAGPTTILGKWAFASPATTDRRRGTPVPNWADLVAHDIAKINASPAECYVMAYWKARIAYAPRGPQRKGPR